MLRGEEISSVAFLSCKTTSEAETFIRGASWADYSTIERACEYLYEFNRKQAELFGARAELRPCQYTIDVEAFRNFLLGKS